MTIFKIGRILTRSRELPDCKTGSKKEKRKYRHQFEQGNLSPHLPEFQNIRRQCEYCYKDGIEIKTYAKCIECFLCFLWSKRNYFKNYYS